MERRFYLGLGILAVFLALGIFTSWGIARIQEPVSNILDTAAQTALAGDLNEGIALGRQAHTTWQRHKKATAALADHTPMDEIDSLFAEMEVFAQAEDAEHFSACCAQLARLVQAVSDAHSPGLENIL